MKTDAQIEAEEKQGEKTLWRKIWRWELLFLPLVLLLAYLVNKAFHYAATP